MLKVVFGLAEGHGLRSRRRENITGLWGLSSRRPGRLACRGGRGSRRGGTMRGIAVGVALGALIASPARAGNRARAADAATGPAQALLINTEGKPAGVVSFAVSGTHVRVEVAATGLTA